jgi:RNA polymerase-binding transcription factor DksA
MPAIATAPASADRRTFRAELEARRQQFTNDLQLRVARIRENGADLSVAQKPDEGELCDLDAALADLATTTIRRIDQAIERLDAGTYGQCTRCGGPIGEARLRALPFAVCCRHCEVAREQEAARLAHPERTQAWERGLLSGDIKAPQEP